MRVLLLLLVCIFVIASGQPCEENLSIDVTSGETFHDGTVLHNGIHFPLNYIFKKNVSGEFKTYGCVCKLRKCVRKCCDSGSVVLGTICIENVKDDLIRNYGFNISCRDEFVKTVSLKDSEFTLVYGTPDCRLSPNKAYFKQERDLWHLQEDGQLYIDLPHNIPSWRLRGPDKYCIDTFIQEDEEGHKQATLDALVCFAEEKKTYTDYLISISCMIISCVFILATVVVYAWLPELRNLHGQVLMAYMLCLFVGFAFLASMQILLLVNKITQDWCVGMTFVIYFFLLSAFFWLNVMCFDIWWTFSGKSGLAERLSTRAPFCAYAMYAFGVPTALTITVAVLEFTKLPPDALLPNIKHHGCFFFGFSKLLYLYGPIVILWVANMVFFVLTAMKIGQVKQQTSVLKSKESSMHDQHRHDKQRLTLYVKLFVVMGINWVLEVISAIYPDLKNLWRCTDACNVLIGLIIFIVFVCKRKIFRMIKKRIQERFQRRESSSDSSNLNMNDRKNWRNCQNQRASLDTIKSSLDSTSIRTKITVLNHSHRATNPDKF